MHNVRITRGSNAASSSAGKTKTTMVKREKYKVPGGLPRFRTWNDNGIEDAQEFLDRFKRVCTSHDLDEKFWGRVLYQTLDSTDAKWLDEWRTTFNWEEWDELESAFIRHFQQPNIHALRRQQLRTLSVKSVAVYRDMPMNLRD